MEPYIYGNLILLACIGALGFFFGPDDFGAKSRTVFAIWITWAFFCLSLMGWVIYVAGHFASKYW
jgi:hypothetical protein